MSLREAFVAIKPRESAGPRSSDRFEYQKDWGLCRLLQLHASDADYLVVFDLHDDVLILDSEKDPSVIAFFQIKTKRPRHWSLTDLLRRKPGKNGKLPSILGKLYFNRVDFPGNTARLTFVSNAPVDIPLEAGGDSSSRTVFDCAEIRGPERDKIARQLREECSLAAEPELGDALVFEVSELSLQDHQTHARGRLGDFLEQICPQGKFRVNLVYRALLGEIARRNNYHAELTCFDDVVSKKGLGRSSFGQLLEQVGAYEDYDLLWRQAEQRLNSEALPFPRLVALRRQWQKLEAQRTDPENLILIRLRQRVADAMARLAEVPATLTELIDRVLQSLKAEGGIEPTFEDDDIRALVLMGCYESRQLPPLDSGPAEEQA